jgi:hypothetical protein
MTTTTEIPKSNGPREISDYARRTGWSKVDGSSPSPKYLEALRHGVDVSSKDYHYWNDYDPEEYGELRQQA